MKRALILILCLSICGCGVQAQPEPSLPENWPSLVYDQEWVAKSENYVTKYQQTWDFSQNVTMYDSFGPYLNYHLTKSHDHLQKDPTGIPMVQNGQYYNPVTVSQYALTLHAKGEIDSFLAATDFLLTLQDDSGAFRYNFSWTYYLTGEMYDPGWVSGMAQGQALSVLTRAYSLTGDEKYLAAGNLAFEFMLVPTSEGGVLTTLADLDPSLSQYLWIEEYVSSPANYTLNGYMFALLGLYDWSHYNPSAGNYFTAGVDSLVNMLPYYDIGGFSCYDLGHITHGDKDPHVGVKYHGVHIKLLHALHSITDNIWLQHFEYLWQSYIEGQ